MTDNNENLGNINRITTILNMDDKRLLRQECIHELMDQVNHLFHEMQDAHLNMATANQLKADAMAYEKDPQDNSITTVQKDFKDVLTYLFHKKMHHSDEGTQINDYIKLLQKEA